MMPWLKLLRDTQKTWGRVALIFVALVTGLVALTSVLAIRSVITREMSKNYRGSLAASATVDVGREGLSDADFEFLVQHQNVRSAERRATRTARFERNGEAQRALLFFRSEHLRQDISRVTHLAGNKTLRDDEMFVEQSAMSFFNFHLGEVVVIFVGEKKMALKIVGVVQESALAPAASTQGAYFYSSALAFKKLFGQSTFDEVRVLVKNAPLDLEEVEAQVSTIAHSLLQRGVPIHEIRIPPPGKHPHEGPSQAVMYLLALFAASIFLLALLFTRQLLAIALTRTQKEIAIMRSMGASSKVLVLMFNVNLFVIALASSVSALPLVWLLTRLGTQNIAQLLNLRLDDSAPSLWVYLLHFSVGLALPLLSARSLFRQASTKPINGVLIENHAKDLGWSFTFLKVFDSALAFAAMRSAFRHPKRLAWVVLLLTASGGLMLSAFGSARSWEQLTNKVVVQNMFAAEVVSERPIPQSFSISKEFERWGSARAAISKLDDIPLTRTYPDGGHGALVLKGGPINSNLLRLPLKKGRRLRKGDTDKVLLNQVALAAFRDFRDVEIFDTLSFYIEGREIKLQLVGVVNEIAASATAYVSVDTFEKFELGFHSLLVESDAGVADAKSALHPSKVSVVPAALIVNAMGAHVSLLIQMLVALGFLLSVIGVLSLGSNLIISVIERTREFGVLRAIGALPSQVRGLVVLESLVAAALSLPFAYLLSFLITWVFNTLVGALAFSLSLPFAVNFLALALWALFLLLFSALVALFAVRNANTTSIKEAINHV